MTTRKGRAMVVAVLFSIVLVDASPLRLGRKGALGAPLRLYRLLTHT